MSSSGSSARYVLGLLGAMLIGAAAATVVLQRASGPEVASVVPPRARPGEAVTIKGARFASAPQGNTVLFGSLAGRVLSANAGEVRVEVPEVDVAAGGEVRVGLRILAGNRVSAPVDLAVYREKEGEPTREASSPAASPEPSPATLPPPLPGAVAAPPKAQGGAQRRAAAALPPAVAPIPAPPAATPLSPPAEASRSGAAPPEVTGTSGRGFVLERTAATSTKKVNLALAGFDPAGVDVKRAPDVAGRIDFEVSPGRVKPGDPYAVKVFVINDGGRPIRVKEMFVATTVNGALSAGTVSPRLRDIAPKKREVIGVFSDVWRETTSSWAMDLTVTSERGDVYKNQVSWK